MFKNMSAVTCRVMLIAAFSILAGSFVVMVPRFPAVLLLLVLPLAALNLRGSRLWSHGTARTSWMLDLLRSDMLSGEGLIMGRAGTSQTHSLGEAVMLLLDPRVPSDVACQAVLTVLYKPRWSKERMIRIKDFVNLLTVAPAGAGKSVSVLIPNLWSYRGSCVVNDPKGELWAKTAAHRRDKLGQLVFLLDPYGVCKAGSMTFNPLDFIDENALDFLDKCRDLANMLVVRTGEEREPYWNDQAEIVLTGFIAFVCACESDRKLRTLTTVRKLVSSRKRFTRAIQRMAEVPGFHGVISGHGQLLQWPADRELASIMSNVQKHTAWIDTPLVAECLSHTSFDPRLLRTSRGVTAYFVLPHDVLVTMKPWLRTLIGCTIRIATQGGADETNPLLFMIDEAGHLGHMQALQDAVTLLRGYGIRLWFFFQSLGQLHECYGNHAAVILDNLGTQQYFGITSYETAEAISKRVGDQTISVRTQTGGSSSSWPTGSGLQGPQPGNRSINRGWSISEVARRLMKPEEILVLHEMMCILFHRNNPVMLAKRVTRWDREFKNGGDGRQGRMGLPAFQTLLLAVFLSALMFPLGDGSPPVTSPWPGLRTDGQMAAPTYGIDQPVPLVPVMPALPDAPQPRLPRTSSEPWQIDRFGLQKPTYGTGRSRTTIPRPSVPPPPQPMPPRPSREPQFNPFKFQTSPENRPARVA